MTLRDIGTWLGSMWDRILADFQVVVSSSPLDWPLWIFLAGFVLVFIVFPIVAGTILRAVRDYIQNEPPMGLGWCVGLTIGAVLCAMVLVDLHVTKALYDDAKPAPRFLYVAYPIMTALFGFSAFVECRKQLRIWRGRR